MMSPEGILVINKPAERTSFSVVAEVRRKSKQKKVGHAGTLDPFATGVLVLLLGRSYTRLADRFLQDDKEYISTFFLGASTDTYDRDGAILQQTSYIPCNSEVLGLTEEFQGEYLQTPPMFSAKKQNGTPLYKFARKGIDLPRKPQPVNICIRVLSYEYPHLTLSIACSKGTYIRSIADDFGKRLRTFAHVQTLERTRSGPFSLDQALTDEQFEQLNPADIQQYFLNQAVYANS